jgi:chemotaxis signal transduction protein
MSERTPTAYQRFLDLPPAQRQVLKERAKELAKPLDAGAQEARGDLVELLEIHSRGQVVAVPLSVVEGIGELLSIAAVPHAPRVLRGVVSFRGEVLFGLEISALLGSTSTGFSDLRRIIVVSAGGLKAAILAEKAVNIRDARASAFFRDRLVPQDFVVGVDSTFVTLLDPELLLRSAFRSIEGVGG